MIEDEQHWSTLSNYERIKLIKQNWLFIKYFKNQTEEECIAAVQQSSSALQYVTNQTHKICLEAIKQNPLSLSMIINKTNALCIEAVKLNPMAFQYIPAHLQTLEICEIALQQDGMCLKYVANQTERLCYTSLTSSKGASFGLIKNQTKFLCKEAMKLDGTLLFYVIDQTFEICLEAVKQNSQAIKYVKFDSFSEKNIEILTYEAVKKNGNVIQYIDKKYHTQKICIIALKANKNNINYIDYDRFNISLIDFDDVTNKVFPCCANISATPSLAKGESLNNSLITVNQENYYVIKTNVITDCIRNVKLNDEIPTSQAFEKYLNDLIEKIKGKYNDKKVSTVIEGKGDEEKEDEGKDEENKEGIKEGKKRMNDNVTIDIILKKVSATKYEIYEHTTKIRYLYYFYKSKDESEKLLYKLELFKYTTGLIL